MLLVRVGRVQKPHGLKGFLKVAYTTDHPEWIETRDRYLLLDPVTRECRQLEVTEVQLKPNHCLLKFKGFDAPEPLKFLNGWDVVYFTERGAVQRDDPDEVYFFELEGMEARSPDGAVLGTVIDVIETGATVVLELDTPGSKLIPFTRKRVPELNLAEAWLVIAPLE